MLGDPALILLRIAFAERLGSKKAKKSKGKGSDSEDDDATESEDESDGDDGDKKGSGSDSGANLAWLLFRLCLRLFVPSDCDFTLHVLMCCLPCSAWSRAQTETASARAKTRKEARAAMARNRNLARANSGSRDHSPCPIVPVERLDCSLIDLQRGSEAAAQGSDAVAGQLPSAAKVRLRRVSARSVRLPDSLLNGLVAGRALGRSALHLRVSTPVVRVYS